MSTRVHKDQLSPTATNPKMEYVDHNDQGKRIFTATHRCFHDDRSPLSHTLRFQGSTFRGRAGLAPTTYPSLTSMIENVYAQRGNPRIPSAKERFFISHSTTNQFDLLTSVDLGEDLVKSIQHQQSGRRMTPRDIQKQLQTQHITLKNGVRGRYKTQDGVVDLRNTISGSWDRKSPNLQMARRIAPAKNGKADPSAPSDYYTGRPETYAKAEEMAEMVFFGEMEVPSQKDRKGISVNPDGSYTLKIGINCLESVSPLYGIANVEQEQDYVKSEAEALRQLERESKASPLTFIHPITKKVYRVRVETALIETQVNVFGRAEKTFSSPSSGKQRATAISREGWDRLKNWADKELEKLNVNLKSFAKQDSPEAEEIGAKINQINTIKRLLDKSLSGGFTDRLEPAKELLCYSLLMQLVGIPQLIHCKSSTDRTSFGIMTSVLRQWKDLGLEIPDDIISLTDNKLFKELFAANWTSCHAVTRNARSPHGTLTHGGKEVVLDNEVLGIATNSGMSECVLPASLLPDRYLKASGFWQETLVKPVKAVANFMASVWQSGFLGKIGAVLLLPALALSVFSPLYAYAARFAVTLADVFLPYADGVCRRPKNALVRLIAFPFQLVYTIAYRCIFEHFKADSSFWYGTRKPPKNRLARFVFSFLSMPFALAWRLVINPLLLFRMMPDKVIDTDKEFIKNRRLIKSKSGHQAKFEEAGKAVPSKARSATEYNELFIKRFMNPIRPARVKIDGDLVDETMSADSTFKNSVGEPDQDKIEAQFNKDIERGSPFIIDGKKFKTNAVEILAYLQSRAVDKHGRFDQTKYLRCLVMCSQAATGTVYTHTANLLQEDMSSGMHADAENRIRVVEQPNRPGRPKITFSISTEGEWSLEAMSTYHLVRGETTRARIHAQLDSKISVNLESGKADITWEVQKGANGKPLFIPFKEVEAEEFVEEQESI